jgi:hypothetical protein
MCPIDLILFDLIAQLTDKEHENHLITNLF